MTLIRDGLWGIVNETEMAPREGTEVQARFTARHDKALVTIVLVTEPSLLNVTGTDPTDPVVVRKVLADQFQCKTWVNELELKQKLFSITLAEGGSVQDHIKYMAEIMMICQWQTSVRMLASC